MNRRSLALLLCLAAGCQQHARPATQPAMQASAPATQPRSAVVLGGEDRPNLTSVPSEGDIIVQLDVYQLVLPFGRISRNEEFWKKVDEDHLDVTAHDLLLKNGIRYGIANDDDWSYFKSLIDEYCPKSQRGSMPPLVAGVCPPMTLRTGIESEDIFFLEADGTVKGRTYHNCENLLNIAFEAIPHRPGDTRLKIGATVQDLQRQLDVSVLNKVQEVNLVRPEHIYDLNLMAEVPFNHFLIVAPAPMTQTSRTSLGGAFLTLPGLSEVSEVVLVLVPKPMRLGKEVSVRERETQKKPSAPSKVGGK